MNVEATVLYELCGRLEVEDTELADPKENESVCRPFWAMDAQERLEMEEFTIYFLRNTRTGGFTKEVYLDMGFNKAEIAETRELRKEKAQSADFAMFQSLFKREMPYTLVNNLHRCGVLSETMKANLEQEHRVNVVEHLAAD